MKKSILSLLLLGAVVTSCDMNLTPAGTITPESELFFTDMTKIRTGMYSSFRGGCTGAYLTYPDLMADHFNGTIDNGNRNGIIANKLFTSSTDVFSDVYSALYGSIASLNFDIETFEKFLTKTTLTDEERAYVNLYLGEAKFFRAYRYWYLFDHYCQHYTPARGNEPALGLSLTLKYDPTGNSSNYPGRSTMNETLKVINDDMTDAYNNILAFEQAFGTSSSIAPMSAYLNTNIVKAFEARIKLTLEDYEGAIAAAEPIVKSGTYPLTPNSSYANIWKNDTGTELLMLPYADSSEGGGVSFWGTYNSSNSADKADYIPSEVLLWSYDRTNDARFGAFFTGVELNIQNNSYTTYILNKYPGNSALGSGRVNKAKPFRSSELYLILAEAYAMQGTNPDKGLEYLNTLLKARYKANKFTDLALQGDALINRIREERSKEFVAEGFRFTDLKRWGLGFTRDINYPELDKLAGNTTPLSTALNPLGGRVEYTANDPFYTWPIPADEMDINPQLAGQQNPGY